MFEPKYTITPKLLSNIKKITSLITALNHRGFPDTVLMELEKSARELSAYSSTSIEGNPLPLTEVKRILKNRPANLRDSEKEVINYNNAILKLKESSGEKTSTLNMKLILEIHKTVLDGLASKHRIGRLRTEPVFVNDPKAGKPVYLPPDHKDVKPLMDELLSYIEKNRNVTDPLILAGIFHRQFVIIHPFSDGNGRTARLITKCLLAATGINTFNLFSFENYYNRNVSRYFQNVGVSGNFYDIKGKTDFSGWLEYFTDGIIDELLRVSKELDTKSGMMPELRIKDHEKHLLDYIKANGFITDKDYSRITERAKATRSMDFNRLIRMGLIERKGKGKSTYYVVLLP
jgi:Fic family protein